MAQPKIHIAVRSPAGGIRILDIQGGITGDAGEALFAAYNAASNDARAIILNLSEVPAIDSLGAGLLIALLARVRKQRQRLLAYGLSEHCRRAFELTHLDEMVGLYRDEAEAIGSI
jgi:anti-sigma B factor antagonist